MRNIPTPAYEAIVMGASWGGTEALIEILRGLPADFSIPVIIVLHRQKNAESFLDDILNKHLKLLVKEVEDKEPINPSVVYVAPANYHVLIERDFTLALDTSADVSYSRPSIDVLFESAAKVYKSKLIGVLLTGANSDGRDGIAAIAGYKGLTIVQDPAEAKSDVMPKAAIAATRVDHILRKKEIFEMLKKLGGGGFE